MPLPSILRVTNLENGRQLLVRVNDRGPFVGDRIIDLSYRSAEILGVIEKGTANVKLELLDYGPHLLNSKNSANNMIEKKSFLQVGVFKEANNADKLYAKLRNISYLNYKVFIDTTESNNETLYVVKIGPINSKENMMYVKENLRVMILDLK